MECRDAFGRRGFVMASLEVSLINYFGLAVYSWLTKAPTGEDRLGAYLLLTVTYSVAASNTVKAPHGQNPSGSF